MSGIARCDFRGQASLLQGEAMPQIAPMPTLRDNAGQFQE
ncbi:hypothetical protein C4K26_1967 [Pseudomonas chlororaphis]|nr:hypothetical protein C4K26_1967 [Pseudomonas chlororaphis]